MIGGANGAVMEEDPFQSLEVPAQLEAAMQRHRENLARLVASLRSAGVDEAQIEASVTVVIASYKDELLRAMKEMVR